MSSFLDEARIFVKSGRGGNGIVSFRREKFVDRGGPDGGDGGKGGDVVLVANPKLNTLRQYGHQIHYKAEPGKHGQGSRKTGASADDLELEVPVGTIVRDADSEQVIADLAEAGQRVVVAKGGRGGRGNTHWKNSRNQAPTVAEKGAPGEERWLKLELKLLADVGIIGMPSVGKSTLLSVISNARPEIADYHFTTLTPNLGVVKLGYQELIFADIPGLIEGAHMGVGLGHAFLRHIQRTRLLLHLVDAAAQDPIADFHQINSELALFDERLTERQQIVVISKSDLPDVQAGWELYQQQFQQLGYPVVAISAATHGNIDSLLNLTFETYANLPPAAPPVSIDESTVYSLEADPREFTVEKLEDGLFQVHGQRIEQAAAMTYWGYTDAVRRFQRILETLGISKALEEAGVEVGDRVLIGEIELEWMEG